MLRKKGWCLVIRHRLTSQKLKYLFIFLKYDKGLATQFKANRQTTNKAEHVPLIRENMCDSS